MFKKCGILLFCLTWLVSCNANQNANDNRTAENENLVRVKNSTFDENVDRESGQEIASHLVELTTRVPNVEDATAVVLGGYAFVGIDVDANMERSQVGTVKYSVLEALKDDPYGAQAIVVADPDIVQRLREIGADIENGRPIQGILNELSDITGRVMPDIPLHLEETTPKNATEKPKNQVNQQEEQQLNKEQNDQSNRQK
ncbi:YhcN/YlaJ family sporulation lipoprotein [Bacillus oleivorans]|uniref:YhcN/YlaJ family sporulation lipoprotein n=1 Tax=Bacillus oleivorans TaxID=1448271 RepID=A0A285D0R9_9BACI|nr:YhcN/YlaJ family sporulation lipoprotein [Bacillus oleivorans]SNX73275.1 YhcN/YlaJ family sporulation lipoprotein [Bacillus oleivorans]